MARTCPQAKDIAPTLPRFVSDAYEILNEELADDRGNRVRYHDSILYQRLRLEFGAAQHHISDGHAAREC
jgi:hypothetical protein